MMRYNALQTLARISVPVLVVAGDGDPVTNRRLPSASILAFQEQGWSPSLLLSISG